MLRGEDVMEISVLTKQGMSIREIACRTGLSRNTVRKYLRTCCEPIYGPRAPGTSKLDPYKRYLQERVKAASPRQIPGTVLLRELRSLGYHGGITILRDYLRTLRIPSPPSPIIRFETEPGEQMQVDVGIIRRGKNRLLIFVAILGFSRAAFVRFVTNENLQTLLACHEAAFEALGGVPRTILYDNMKTVVVQRHGFGRGHHRFQQVFREFAKHHGFLPRLCRPYRVQTKGKVERFIGYVKRSFVVPLASQLKQVGLTLDAATANGAVQTWLKEVANRRQHGTTGKQPWQMLLEERPYLLALPPRWSGNRQPASRPVICPIQRDLTAYETLLHQNLRERL